MRDARALWASSLLRRYRRQTALLVVLTALAASAAMTAWEYSRRAGSVIDRRVEAARPADGVLNTCAPGLDPGEDITPCFAVESNEIAYRTLENSANVSATSLSFSGLVEVAASADGAASPTFSGAVVHRTGVIGTPNVVSGRPPLPNAADEVMLTERIARSVGVRANEYVWLGGCAFDFGQGESTCGARERFRVAGIIRADSDLLPARQSPPGIEDDPDFGLFAERAWFTSFGERYVAFPQTNFRLAPGSTLDDLRADIERRLPPGWTVLVAPPEDATIYDGLRQSTHLQATALLGVAVILTLAGLVFVGQTTSRQIRRELDDHQIMRAIGAKKSDAVAVTARRMLNVAVGAAALAAAIAAFASRFGPPNLAGRAEVDPGYRFDSFVLVVGVAATMAFVLALSVLTSLLIQNPPSKRGARVFGSRFPGTATASAGFALGRACRGGGVRAAVAGVSAALGGVVVAGILVNSLNAVDRDPVRYGASWDYSVGDFMGNDSSGSETARLSADPLLTDVSFVFSSGPVRLSNVPAFWVLSFASISGDLGPVIVEGRAPLADDEVAVGIATLEALGKGVGDVIDAVPILARGGASTGAANDAVGPLTIVGSVLISDDSRSVGPGNGMIVTESTRLQIDPAASPGVLVRTDPAVGPVETARRLAADYGSVRVPNPQSDISNLLLISNTPWLIALLVAALATAALGHALIELVRRSRRDAGVLRALGFTRSQVAAAVCWYATALIMLAVVIGVPFGIIAGRWGWALLAARIGLANTTVVPLLAACLAAGVAIVIANLIAVVPSWLLARRNTSELLRAE